MHVLAHYAPRIPLIEPARPGSALPCASLPGRPCSYEVSFDPTAATAIATVKNLKSGVTGTVAIDIGFYNASIGGCTAGVGSAAAQQALQKQPASHLDRARREEGEFGMVSAGGGGYAGRLPGGRITCWRADG